MKHLIGYLLIVGALSSCVDFLDEYHYFVTPELLPFVKLFYTESQKRGFDLPTDGLSVSLYHYRNGDAGDSFNGSLIIVLDPDFVHRNLATGYRGDSLWVEWVVFHELGHGLLYRDHCAGESIMNPHNEHINEYSSNVAARQRMINELFTNCHIYPNK